MRLKLTIFLILLNVLLFGVLITLEKSRSTSALFASQSRLVLEPGFVPGIRSITVTSPAMGIDWVFSRDGDAGWSMASPHHWRANGFAVESLLNQLLFLRWETRFSRAEAEASGQTMTAYGLEPPALRLTLRSDSDTRTLAIGAPTEIGQRLYILSPDETEIMVVSRELLASLSRELGSYVERRVLDIPPFEVSAIQVQDRTQGNVRIRLVRSGAAWSFESPIRTPASRAAVERFLDQLADLQLDSLVAADPATSGLDSPRLRLTIEGLNRRQHLLIGNLVETAANTPLVHARREDYTAHFVVPAAIYGLVRDAQDSLRERRLLHTLGDDWSSIEIRQDPFATNLQRLESGQWQIIARDDAGNLQSLPADPGVVQTLIERLTRLEAVAFATDAPAEADLQRFGLNNPQRTVRIRTERGDQATLLIGNLAADQPLLYCQIQQAPTVSRVSPLILGDLPLSPLHYRHRVVRTLPASATIDSIRLIRRADGAVLLDSAVRNGNGGAPDAQALAALDAWVRETRAERFLSQPFSDPLILDARRTLRWTHIIEATIRTTGSETAGPLETLRIVLSDRVGGLFQYAGLDSRHPVMNLPLSLIEALQPVMQPVPASVEGLPSGEL
jgi:hypothetical protein